MKAAHRIGVLALTDIARPFVMRNSEGANEFLNR